MHNTLGFWGLLASWLFFGGCSLRAVVVIVFPLLRGDR